MSTSDEEMLVVRSLRQAFESYGGPGSSVNATQNPFYMQLTGQFDILQAAKLVLANLEAQRVNKERVAREEAGARTRQEAALAGARTQNEAVMIQKALDTSARQAQEAKAAQDTEPDPLA